MIKTTLPPMEVALLTSTEPWVEASYPGYHRLPVEWSNYDERAQCHISRQDEFLWPGPTEGEVSIEGYALVPVPGEAWLNQPAMRLPWPVRLSPGEGFRLSRMTADMICE